MISVIVPVFNEAENLAALYEQAVVVLKRLGQPWELIFINDGSTDNSQDKLEELAERDASVKVIKFCRNFGQTAAMMAGVDYAEGHIIIPMDGDLQNDPEDIPRLLEKLEQGFDVVSGWRQDRKDNPINRTLPSRVANGIISYVSGVHLHDYGCSLKAYRKDVIKGIRLYGEMHRFIPIYASCLGARITEIPVQHHPRQNGVSKYGISRVMKVLLDLLVVKFLAKYSGKPMYLFGAVGMGILVVSLMVVAWALYLKFAEGVSLISTPLPLLGVMAGISGFMCILMGLLAEVLVRTYYEAQGKTVYLIGKTCNIKQHSLQG